MKKHLVVLIALLAALLVSASIASASTVPTDGYIMPTDVVAKGDLAEITHIGDHVVDFARCTIVKEPTCTDLGLARFDCLTPEMHGATTAYHDVYVDTIGHVWSSMSGDPDWGKVIKEATCNDPGLAIDVCLVCGEENPNKTRTILTAHVYYDNTYETVLAPKCDGYGAGIHKCIYCGQLDPADVEMWEYVVENKLEDVLKFGDFSIVDNRLVKIPMTPHKWTQWNIIESTCDKYGAAWRACELCGATQLLDASHELVEDHMDEFARMTFRGVTGWFPYKVHRDDIIPLKNPNWDDELVKYIDGQKFATQNDKDAAFRNVRTSKYEVKKDWLDDCYTRNVTLTCPYCKGKVHADVTYTMVYPLVAAHEWKLQGYSFESSQQYVGKMTAEEILADDFFNNDQSLRPSCTLPGFELYLCAHDKNCDAWQKENPYDVHGHPETFGEYFDDPAFIKIAKDPIGHTYSDWEIIDAWKNAEGEDVVQRIRRCTTCKIVTDNQIIKLSEIPEEERIFPDDPEVKPDEPEVKPDEPEVKPDEPEVPAEKKDGLVLEDGAWKYYVDDKFQEDYLGIVKYDGGEFMVVSGVVADLDGLTNCPGDKWYFLADGQIQRVAGFAEYAGEWFMLKNGELDVDANGLYDYNGGTFAFAAGKLRTDINGLWQNPRDGKWYFLANGQVQKVTQEVTYNGATFNVVDGVLAE